MTRFKTKKEDTSLDDSYVRYDRRMKQAQERIKEKNIVLWDEVVCDREVDWIYQRKWKYTWSVVKDYHYMNIRYDVEFERNWMKKIYPIHIDCIRKILDSKQKKRWRPKTR
jgi:hypothetical protein